MMIPSRRTFLQSLLATLGGGYGIHRAWASLEQDTSRVIRGEEWRRMEGAQRPYDCQASARVAARAGQRIRQIRQKDQEIILTDAQGDPLSQIKARVVQMRNEFPVGDQLWRLQEFYRFDEHETDLGFYWRHRFKNVFNSANALCYWTERPRNDGPKTEDIQGRQQLDDFAYAVDWINSENMLAKGHPLFWSIPKCVPEWVKRYDIETQYKFAEVRVRDLVSRFRGKVKMWDAVNEILWEPAFKNLNRRHWPYLETLENVTEMVARVLSWAREEDPDAKYLINDYGLIQESEKGPPTAPDGTVVTSKLQRKRYLDIARRLIDMGSPPDALGLQSHIGGWVNQDEQLAFYDEIAQAGLPLHITEFWAKTGWLQEQGMDQQEIDERQAEYVSNTLTVAYSHPAVEAFFFWGFMSSAIEWKRRSAHELKPMYHRIQDLLKNEWMTRTEIETNADGRTSFRGFCGDYVLRLILPSGQETGIPFTLNRSQNEPMKLQTPLLGL
jgi:GH35 family endo-1,4-beta-xylanase